MADEDEAGFKVFIDGKAYMADPTEMELWEVELLEETCDLPLERIDFDRVKAVRVLVYILKRREDPAFTMDDARHLSLSRLGEPEPEPEPAPEPEPLAKPAARKRPTKAASKSG